ncbi:uncharacterized protein LOC112677905 isoform X1 [Canis lupus dingo]|uniref:uncharacterized protein LOC112677905 isoform X1 n=1 Tax=Canis lupus dingo TaxID=286419 RepID=UPI0015F182FF|nr:uncharacterized protein LOC112677905 isoform X1 [Canis lupus dingo]XP_048971704.1 uncharacterized protein LOC112677905 isoform X1 [Canis lupus dingo]
MEKYCGVTQRDTHRPLSSAHPGSPAGAPCARSGTPHLKAGSGPPHLARRALSAPKHRLLPAKQDPVGGDFSLFPKESPRGPLHGQHPHPPHPCLCLSTPSPRIRVSVCPCIYASVHLCILASAHPCVHAFETRPDLQELGPGLRRDRPPFPVTQPRGCRGLRRGWGPRGPQPAALTAEDRLGDCLPGGHLREPSLPACASRFLSALCGLAAAWSREVLLPLLLGSFLPFLFSFLFFLVVNNNHYFGLATSQQRFWGPRELPSLSPPPPLPLLLASLLLSLLFLRFLLLPSPLPFPLPSPPPSLPPPPLPPPPPPPPPGFFSLMFLGIKGRSPGTLQLKTLMRTMPEKSRLPET